MEIPSTQPQDALQDQQSASPASRPAVLGVCGGCDARWAGHRPAHCGACHETFSAPTAFDLHRRNTGPRGACVDPATIDRLTFRDGMWSYPKMDEATLSAVIS